MSNVNEVVASYIGAWNERDPKKRRDLVAKTWTDDGVYIDAHRKGSGHDQIDAMIAGVQEKFGGYRFGLVSGIETHNGYVRFTWAAGGAAEAPLYFRGTDFAIRGEDGRLQSVAGFTDAAPAAA
jgi:hypothetical protein